MRKKIVVLLMAICSVFAFATKARAIDVWQVHEGVTILQLKMVQNQLEQTPEYWKHWYNVSHSTNLNLKKQIGDLEQAKQKAENELNETKQKLQEAQKNQQQLTEQVNTMQQTITQLKAAKESQYIEKRTFTTTAYCPCAQCSEGYGRATALGTVAREKHTIAASKAYPYGTQIEIDGIVYTVEDRGGAVQGNTIDIFMESHSATVQYGRRVVEGKIIRWG